MLTNNLVLSKADNTALAEVLGSRQPGDKMRICVDVTIVENLTDRTTFDVTAAEELGKSDEPVYAKDEAAEKKMSPLAESVLGVMSKTK